MAQERELKELKSVLRSLVVSSPAQVDVRALLRDYRTMVGAPVPFAKHGYRDPVLFLKEHCSDSFVFQGPPSNPILTLIVPETLKHIDQFVQRQKVSSTIKFKGKRRSIPEKVMQQKDMIVHTFVPKSQAEKQNKTIKIPVDLNTSNEPLETSSKSEPETPKKSLITNSRTYSNLYTATTNTESTTQDKENKLANANNQIDKEEVNSQNAVHNFLKKRMPLYSSMQQAESEVSYDCQTSSKGDDDSGRQTSSSSSSTKAALLEELKIEIRDLVADYPEGVWCTDLIGLYRERYKRELKFARFGYTSIISLVCMLEDAVTISRPVATGDWLVRDARAAPAARARRPPPAAAPAQRASRRVDVDDALPGIDFDPDVFPSDCVHFMESIPAAALGALRPGAMLEVVVGEVYSPSHFWLLRLGERYNIAMEDMMDEMTQYYTYGEGKDRSLALGAVRVGHYCSSVYERDWHRSLIVRIVDSDTVKVRHVDYGTVESVRARSLKPLRREWAALPAQAVRARLAAVRPPAAGRRWPHAASAHFLALVRDARLVANVVAVDREEDILEVFLINTSTAEDVCISAEMIRSGHADPRGDSALGTPDCYLFPRFDVLEAGDTPNFGEIHAYLRDGIALEYVDEYRRHVPACLPPSPPAPRTPSPDPPPAPDTPPEPSSGAASEAGDDEEDHSTCLLTAAPLSPRRLTRAASSPGESSPTDPPTPPTRSKSANPNITVPDARLEVINRVPLWAPRAPAPRPPAPAPHPPAPAPRPPAPARRPRPPAPRPPPHAYSQMIPVPGYAGFPPFPGALPLYPPMFAPPPPPILLPPGPFSPVPYGPPVPHPPVPYASAPSPHPPITYSSAPASDAPAPAPTPRPVSPPPPYNGAGATAAEGAVSLSVSECEVFKLLSQVDASAAHWYIVDAISRAMRTRTTSAADGPAPAAARRLAAGTQTDSQPALRLPPGMRPPPGFDR